MNFNRYYLFVFLQITFVLGCIAQTPNKLSNKEKETGWVLLFDGKTFDGWRKLANDGWTIKNGELSAIGAINGKQMDLLTTGQFDSFELFFEFRIAKKSNSGVKYLVSNDYPGHKGTYLGLEYQILDDVNFKYPERGELRSLSSLYDLIAAGKKKTMPLGHWNTARIIVDKNQISHWLNGDKIIAYNRSSSAFTALVKTSKYKDLKNFGESKKGHILLQNEGSPISFRNIKIKSIRQ